MRDLIDRQAVLELPRNVERTFFGEVISETVDVKVIEALPTIESRAKGHWVPQKGGGVCCSECGEYALNKADGRYVLVSVMSKFCPSCGADMREESNG